LYRECLAGAQIFPESGRGLGHMTLTIFGSTVGYPSDSLASCSMIHPSDRWTDGRAIAYTRYSIMSRVKMTYSLWRRTITSLLFWCDSL